jgi:hypothetical protein
MINKAKIVADIRREFAEWRKKWDFKGNPAKACFYHAVFTHGHLKNLGLFNKVLISAGTFSIVRLAVDDGISPTHFSYTFTPDRAAMEAVENDRMPEMHCWVTIPETQEVVDLTTCYLKDQCKELTGLDWKAPDPPDYVWHHIDSLPCGIEYTPSREAVALVQYFFQRTWG